MTAATMNELDRLRRDRDALRARAQQAEEDTHQLLQLLAKIRAAAGDPEGKMMQFELIAHIQEMRDVLIQERADMRRTGGGISADTKINGGELVAVDFDGSRLHVCQQLEEALDRMVTQFGPIDWCDTEDAREAVELAIDALAKAREVKS